MIKDFDHKFDHFHFEVVFQCQKVEMIIALTKFHN